MIKIRMVALAALVGVAGLGWQICVAAPASAADRGSAVTLVPTDRQSDAAAAAAFAESQIGKRYMWGTSGPVTYDAPGLVQAAYATVGVTLPRDPAGQAAVTTPVDESDLQVGDLVFYGTDSIGIVAIYIGDDEVACAVPNDHVRPKLIDFAPVYSYGRVG